MIFRATGGTVGTLTVSQVSPGRKNRLWLEIDAADASVVFDQENSEWLWLGRRSAGEIIARDGRGTTAPRGDTSFLPPGHPRGFVECFASLFADVYCAIRNEPGRAFPHLRRWCAQRRADRGCPALGERAEVGAYRMKLGLLTACLPDVPLLDIADWASAHGFEALEVAAWPPTSSRPFEASHLDVTSLGAAAAEDLAADLTARDLSISALAYYENNLHHDPAARAEIHVHLRRCIDAAQRWAASSSAPSSAVTSVTRSRRTCGWPSRNCRRWSTTPANGACGSSSRTAPWRAGIPDGYPANLGLLAGTVGVDVLPRVLPQLRPVASDLARHRPGRRASGPARSGSSHAQAKDVEIDAAARNRVGVFGRAVDRSNPWDNGWWRYRVPGLGEVDWRRIVDTLYQVGFDGVLSVEHEDPVWSGRPSRVLSGLLIAQARRCGR